jgi:hypothetical protein
MLNAAGTLDGLFEAGYDVIFVGLDQGADQVQRNAGVLIECMREAGRRTSAPLVVGGVSLGGLVSRYALALLESRGEAHSTRAYVSIDSPHEGAYTSLGVQWFVKSLLPFTPALAGFEALLDSPGNQQMMLSYLRDDGTAGVSPLREQLRTDLEAVGGWPKAPRKLAVSCGRGDGEGSATPGTRTLGWDGKPFVSATLNTLPGADGVVAEGSWFLNDPPELRRLEVDPGQAHWESAPGGQNTYNGQVAAIAALLGCGTVQHDLDRSCSLPTISALLAARRAGRSGAAWRLRSSRVQPARPRVPGRPVSGLRELPRGGARIRGQAVRQLLGLPQRRRAPRPDRAEDVPQELATGSRAPEARPDRGDAILPTRPVQLGPAAPR